MNNEAILKVIQEAHRDTIRLFMLRPPKKQGKRHRAELRKTERMLEKMVRE